jgi:hypothetical protein
VLQRRGTILFRRDALGAPLAWPNPPPSLFSEHCFHLSCRCCCWRSGASRRVWAGENSPGRMTLQFDKYAHVKLLNVVQQKRCALDCVDDNENYLPWERWLRCWAVGSSPALPPPRWRRSRPACSGPCSGPCPGPCSSEEEASSCRPTSPAGKAGKPKTLLMLEELDAPLRAAGTTMTMIDKFLISKSWDAQDWKGFSKNFRSKKMLRHSPFEILGVVSCELTEPSELLS